MPTYYRYPKEQVEKYNQARSWLMDSLSSLSGFAPQEPESKEQLLSGLAGAVVPTAEELATMPGISMPGMAVNPIEASSKLILPPIRQFLSRYKSFRDRPIPFGEGPAKEVFRELGPNLLTSTLGGLSLRQNPAVKGAYDYGIAPYIDDIASSLFPSKGFAGRAYPFKEEMGKKVGSIWTDVEDVERNLVIPAIFIGGRRNIEPLDFLRALFHEGGHIKYRMDPDVAKEALNITEPFHKHIPQYRSRVEAYGKEPGFGFPYSTKEQQSFEETLVEGVARSLMKELFPSYEIKYDMPQARKIPEMFYNKPLMKDLKDLFYGAP